MGSVKGHLQQYKRQYFQYRFFNGYGKRETTRRFDEDIFPKIDRGGTCKNDFSQQNWNLAADQWEQEWNIGSGGPSEECWKEMSTLRVWYDGDIQILDPRVTILHRLEPDYLRWRKLQGAQNARGIQAAANHGDRRIMEPSSVFQTPFPSHSHGPCHEARRHPNTTTPATSVPPWPSTWPQNTVSQPTGFMPSSQPYAIGPTRMENTSAQMGTSLFDPAGFIPSSIPSAFDPTRMEDMSAQMDPSLLEPDTMADTCWQWAPNNNEGFQDCIWYQNEHDQY